jgi:hypothetical protein
MGTGEFVCANYFLTSSEIAKKVLTVSLPRLGAPTARTHHTKER